MDNLVWLSALIPIAGIGVFVLFIVSIVQHMKQDQKGGFKQAFYTIVSFVMLAITVGSLIALLSAGLRQTVFKDALGNRYDMPPSIFFAGTTAEKSPSLVAQTCTDSCTLTADDKAQFTSWKTQYQDWQKRTNSNTQFRSTLASSLAFLIVGLPLYIVFMRLMEKGAKREQDGNKKPTALRSLYYYFIAFSGLLFMAISAGFLINTGLRVWLKAETSTTTSPMVLSGTAIDLPTASAQSVINCADKCGFTASDVALAQQWIVDQEKFTAKGKSLTAQRQGDLVNQLPLLAVSIPLFWYHFARIRKEFKEGQGLTQKA